MSIILRSLLLTTCLVVGGLAGDAPLVLWYRQPASDSGMIDNSNTKFLTEALPVGSGRLGAMVMGGVGHERLVINEDTMWSGGPYDPSNPGALEALPEARKRVFAGQFKEAVDIIGGRMMGRPAGQASFQLIGNLHLDFPGHDQPQDYRRWLDLDTAIAGVAYAINGVRFNREIFASPIDQVLVIRLTSDQPGRITTTLGFTTEIPNAAVKGAGVDGLEIGGRNSDSSPAPGALTFACRVRALAKAGTVRVAGDKLTITKADSVTLILDAATSYKTWKDVSGDPVANVQTRLAAAVAKPYERLRKDHVAEHQRLFRRVSLDLGTTSAADLPTDERVRANNLDADPALATLYFQYARYLLASCSRPGFQPANLQGMWNDRMNAPWGGKYTININTEMNYWPAEAANLAECTEPLIRMIVELAESGTRIAKANYGARGWVAHHNTDLWRGAAPIVCLR